MTSLLLALRPKLMGQPPKQEKMAISQDDTVDPHESQGRQHTLNRKGFNASHNTGHYHESPSSANYLTILFC